MVNQNERNNVNKGHFVISDSNRTNKPKVIFFFFFFLCHFESSKILKVLIPTINETFESSFVNKVRSKEEKYQTTPKDCSKRLNIIYVKDLDNSNTKKEDYTITWTLLDSVWLSTRRSPSSPVLLLFGFTFIVSSKSSYHVMIFVLRVDPFRDWRDHKVTSKPYRGRYQSI